MPKHTQKRHQIILAALLLCFANQVNAFSIFRDEASFLQIYTGASEVVDFSTPNPSSLTGVSYSIGGGQWAFEVRENAWSPLVNFGSLISSQCCWGATTWYGNYISPTIHTRPFNQFNRIYIYIISPLEIISLATGDGFYGLVPTNENDRFFALPPGVTLTEAKIGYKQVIINSVSEPPSLTFFLIPLAFLIVKRSLASNLKLLNSVPGTFQINKAQLNTH